MGTKMGLIGVLSACILTAAVVGSGASIAQSTSLSIDENALDAWMAGEEKREQTVPLRIEAIKQELASIGNHDWAGVYRSGIPLGRYETVYIAPGSGIAQTSFSCVGQGRPNCGKTEVDEAGIHVEWDFDPQARLFIPIRWGDSHFLIPQSQILQFCIDARSRGRRLTTRHLWQTINRIVPEGAPKIPEPYKKYEKMHHINAKVVSQQVPIGKPKYRHIQGADVVEQVVTLDVGEKNDVLPGMSFWSRKENENGRLTLLVVRTVREINSDAVRTETRFRNSKPVFADDLLGLQVSTQHPAEPDSREADSNAR